MQLDSIILVCFWMLHGGVNKLLCSHLHAHRLNLAGSGSICRAGWVNLCLDPSRDCFMLESG